MNYKLNKENIPSKARIAGLDLVRALAIVCVIGGHYFINTDFNSTPFNSPILFVLGMLQTFSLIGVPLFLMLTGYLNLNKTEISRQYYKGATRVLIAYIVFSVITILVRECYFDEHKSLIKWILDITSFDAIGYAWYIELWIGLFLLTPFLNKLWHAIESKRQRQVLIITLFVCASLPDFTNRYGVSLLPEYWRAAAYPLLAFYLGAYIRSYQPKFKAMHLVAIVTALCLFNPVTSLVVAHGKPMMHLHGGPMGIVAMPLAVCVFMLFYQTDIRSMPVKSLITKVSLLSLEMYLVAYIADRIIYPLWFEALGDSQATLAPLYVPIVLSLVAATFLTAWVYDILRSLLAKTSATLRPGASREVESM